MLKAWQCRERAAEREHKRSIKSKGEAKDGDVRDSDKYTESYKQVCRGEKIVILKSIIWKINKNNALVINAKNKHLNLKRVVFLLNRSQRFYACFVGRRVWKITDLYGS